MLFTPFSFIWVFQILIRYSKFLRNTYLCILLFSIGYTFHDFTVCFRMEATFSFDFRDGYSH